MRESSRNFVLFAVALFLSYLRQKTGRLAAGIMYVTFAALGSEGVLAR